jgi:carboxymethylenebutenolidase
MAFHDYIAEEIGHDWADGLLSRREAIRRLGLLGLGATGAAAVLAACGGDKKKPARSGATSTTATSGSAASAETIGFAGPRGELIAAFAKPAKAKGAVLVVHENRGLTPHFPAVVSRLAGDGYAALAVDLLSSQGGTAALADPAAAPAALAAAPAEQLVADLRAGIDELTKQVRGAGVGVVGFCFGGGMVWQLLAAKEARLEAAVPFYGPAPDPADFQGAKAAVLAIYGELDQRVNATRDRAEAAMKAAGLTYEIKVFPGADHAFFNDTGPRYNPEAAKTAYADVLSWFGRHLS